MLKPKIYAEIPEFDQRSQAVYQLEPVEMEDCIFVGVEVVDMPSVVEEEIEEYY